MKCTVQFVCDLYPNGSVSDCSLRFGGVGMCDFQAAIGEHIALCCCSVAHKVALKKEVEAQATDKQLAKVDNT